MVQRQTQKHVTANRPEVSSCAIITWFFRLTTCLHCSTHMLVLFTQVSDQVASLLQRQHGLPNFAHSLLASEPGGPHTGGHAGVRLGETRKPWPAEYERDHRLQSHARRTRINTGGDAVHHSRSSKLAARRHPDSAADPSRSSTFGAQVPEDQHSSGYDNKERSCGAPSVARTRRRTAETRTVVSWRI